jgi:anti-anti-sigma factor
MTDHATQARSEFLPATAQQPATVRVSGDIDLANADEFEAALSQAMATSGDTTVDMTKVTYCDSAAIRALFSTAKQTRLTVEVTQEGPVATLLTVSGLDQIATVVTRDD